MSYNGLLTLAMVVLLTKNVKINNTNAMFEFSRYPNLSIAKSETLYALLMMCKKYEMVLFFKRLYYFFAVHRNMSTVFRNFAL